MKAWRVYEYGHFKDVLRFEDVDAPSHLPGTAKIRVHAAGLSFGLILKIAGKYQVRDPLPFIPGLEVAGEVTAVGAGCRFRVGERVMALTHHGTFAEETLVPDDMCYLIPRGMTWTEAAGYLNAYQTAYIGLVERGALAAGQTALVHGAAGGVGLAGVQVAKALGARVVATAGTDAKLEACIQHGAHLAINYREQDFVAKVMEFTDDRGADVILDPVGGDVFDRSRACLAFDGRLVVVGFASGRIPALEANRILLRNLTVTGFTLPAYRDHKPQALAEAQRALDNLYQQGQIAPVISRVLPLDDLVQGIEMLESRDAVGKIVVETGAGER